MERLRQLIHDVHRRSLWQVLGIYVVASWAVLGGIGTLGDVLALPEWFSPLALALLIVGLPIVLATAFVQEGGPGRESEDEEVVAPPVDAPSGGASSLFTWRNAFGGGVLAFALLGFVGTGWILFGGGLGTPDAPTSVEQSVAVLPFDNMSGDPDNEYFSDGITEELLNALAQIPDLRVPGRTSSFAFKGQNLRNQQIADTLGVAHILGGHVKVALLGLQESASLRYDVVPSRHPLAPSSPDAVLEGDGEAGGGGVGLTRLPDPTWASLDLDKRLVLSSI